MKQLLYIKQAFYAGFYYLIRHIGYLRKENSGAVLDKKDSTVIFNKMNIQWFPGHMAKTRRLISDSIKLVDVVVELVDARLPQSSRNPEIDKIISGKPRILVLNKSDISDASANSKWLSYFSRQGITAIAVDSLSGNGVKRIDAAINTVLKDKFEKEAKKGIIKHSVKLMIVGIPNVGKSSLINRLAGRAAAKTGNRPGVTTVKQWIRLSGRYELLDTPGILWPKFDDEMTARKIAYTGGIKDNIIDVEELSCYLLEYLRDNYQQSLKEKYKITDDIQGLTGYELLELVGRKRGAVVSGGSIDTFKAAGFLLDDFRAAKLGKISLELPPE